MIDVLRMGIGSKELLTMLPEERALFLLLGHVSNQVNVLWKTVIIALNRDPVDPVDERVTAAQTQILVRLTVGVLWEGWRLIETRLLGSKLGAEFVPLLDPPSKAALDSLKKRFGSSGMLAAVRNSFAFHTPRTDEMEAAFQLALNEEKLEDVWSIYVSKGLLNCFFFASDVVISHGISKAVGESDLMSSHKKLLNALGPISNELSELSFGVVTAIFRKYFGDEMVMTVVAKIDDAPNISDLRLPFFVNMGVTVDSAGKISPGGS
jgi:hypothetical protein